MNDFAEVMFRLKPPIEENAEIVTAFLSEYPFSTFQTEDNLLMAYADGKALSREMLHEIENLVSAYTEGKPELRYIEKQNWNAIWEQNYFQPIVIAERVGIRATFQKQNRPVQLDLVIQPQMSFGTGHHSTTRLMVEQMLKFETSINGAEVLDMGAGTGILAILAEKLDAKNVVAIDIEEWAAKNISENAELNGCHRIGAFMGDAELLTKYSGKFNIVLANIQKTVLLEDVEKYKSSMVRKGLIFISGFYDSDLQDILKTYEKLGFKLLSNDVLNNWCCAVLELS